MADDPTPDASAPPASLSQDEIARYLATLHVGQGLPNVQPDQTPVDTSGFWGGLRHGISLLGEAAGSPGPEALKVLSPAEREQAGLQSLSRFGTGLMAASHYVPGQTFGSNLAQGFQAAEHGYDTTTRQAMGLLAAKQNYAVASQQADLARLKEALPLLTLRQQAQAGANAAKVALGGAPNTSIGAAGGSADVPAEYLPYFQEASQKTGIPVALLIAQAKQESGFNANATGGAGEVGIMQILPATARNPGGGMTGVDPKDLRDPRTNIMFGAQYLAARLPKGASANDPAAVEAALKAYNGGGDPNYVKNVLRYVPGAQAGVAKASAPPATGANAPVQIPPVTPPVAGSPPPPPPGQQAATPPAPGTAVVAGPGAPTDTTTPPAQVQPPAVFTPRQLTPSEQAATSYALPPEQEAGFRRGVAEVAGQPDAAAKIAAIEQARTAAIATQREKADAARLAIEAKDRATFQANQDEQAKFERDNAAKQAAAVLAHQYELDKIEATGRQTRESTAAGAVVEMNKTQLSALGTEARQASDVINSIDGLKALSDNVKDGGNTRLWASVPFMGDSLLNHMTKLGLADKGEAGRVQMLQGGITSLVQQLKAGMPMGSLSDADLRFIQSLGPQVYQDQDTRNGILAYLRQAQQAKMRMNVEVNNEMTRPGTSFADALDRAQKTMETKHPIVPVVPPDVYAHRTDPDPAWQAKVDKWARDNSVRPGTMYRKPDGSLELVRSTPGGG